MMYRFEIFIHKEYDQKFMRLTKVKASALIETNSLNHPVNDSSLKLLRNGGFSSPRTKLISKWSDFY